MGWGVCITALMTYLNEYIYQLDGLDLGRAKTALQKPLFPLLMQYLNEMSERSNSNRRFPLASIIPMPIIRNYTTKSSMTWSRVLQSSGSLCLGLDVKAETAYLR